MTSSALVITFVRKALTVALLSAIAMTGNLSTGQDLSRLIETIYWSDGDSGRVDGVPFRLSNSDAPETGGVGARSGAKCEYERGLGYEAKAFMVRLTTDSALRVVTVHGVDRYDRLVVDIYANGADIARQAMAAGHLAPWPHKGQKPLFAKPDWCANHRPHRSH